MNTKRRKRRQSGPLPTSPRGGVGHPDGFPPPWGSWKGLEGAAFGDYLKR